MSRGRASSHRRVGAGRQFLSPLAGRRGRAIGAVVDQAASSLTNFVILFAALRALSISSVGVFTFIYTLSLLLVTVVRALAIEPLTIRFTMADATTRRRAVAHAAGASLAIGIGLLLLSLGVASVGPSSVSGPLAAFGVIVPALLVQDAWRIYLFACGRPWSAALNDVTCLLATILVLIVATPLFRPLGTTALLLCWGAGMSAGVVLGSCQARTLPHPWRVWEWLRAHRDIGPALAGERSAESSAAQLSLLLVGVLAGSAALGQLGAARALMAPVTTLTSSMTIFGLPEAARLRNSTGRLVRFAGLMSATTMIAVLVFTSLLLIAPDWFGKSLAGKNWEDAKTLLIPVAIWTAASGARAGPAVALRVYERAGSLLRLSVITGVIVLVATFLASLMWGAHGAAWAFSGVYVIAIINYWNTFLRARAQGVLRSPTDNDAVLASRP